jgi:hypothetical protein
MKQVGFTAERSLYRSTTPYASEPIYGNPLTGVQPADYAVRTVHELYPGCIEDCDYERWGCYGTCRSMPNRDAKAACFRDCNLERRMCKLICRTQPLPRPPR